MTRQELVELLKEAKLEVARDMDNRLVIDIEISENNSRIKTQCMDKKGNISLYKEYKPMYPRWYSINIRKLATAKELPELFKALASIQ